MTLEELAQTVLDYALEHYNDGGWDVIVECWTKEGIVEHWNREWKTYGGPNEVRPVNVPEAIKSFEGLVAIWADRQADARNSAF